MRRICVVIVVLLGAASASAATGRLQSRWLSVEVDKTTGAWALTDARSGVRWPSEGMASAGAAEAFSDGFAAAEEVQEGRALVLRTKSGAEVTFQFRKTDIAPLPWTYPDFRSGIYTPFFLEVRRRWLATRGAHGK